MDDELPGLTYLRRLCEQIPELEVVKAFDNPLKLIESLKDLEFDLCILDIEMPYKNGLEVAIALQHKPVIFTTAYKEYAADAFDLNAVDYIRKPIDKTRLESAVKKALQILGNESGKKNFFQFNTDQGKSLVKLSDIVYITSSDFDKRDKFVMFENNQKLTFKNISYDQLLSILPKLDFCRISKKEIIQLKFVKHFTSNQATLETRENGTYNFQLSDIYKENFLKLLSEKYKG